MTTVYAATSAGLVLLRRSGAPGVHAGANWEVERRLEGLPAQCLAADPARPEHLYCGTFGRGLWRSEDAGASWRPVGDGIRSPQITAVAVSAGERTDGHGVVYAGTEPSALYRSEDGGESWRELPALLDLPSAPTWSFPPRPYTSHVRAIAPDPARAGRLYVAIEAGALVRSDDAGRTWEDRRPDGPFDSHTLATPPQTPGVIYSAAGDGFSRPGDGFAESRDGGDTWRRPGVGLGQHYLWGLAVDPADPATLVVSAARGPRQAHDTESAESALYRRAAGGEWRQVRDGLPPDGGTLAAALAVNAAEPGVFYAGSNRGVYRSADGGVTWERLADAAQAPGAEQRVHALLAIGAG